MIITYSRPDTIGQALDPDAPALDLSQTETSCTASTYDVDGTHWMCTRAPHPGDDRHQGAQVLPGQSAPVVGLEWEYQYSLGEDTGGDVDESAPVHSITVTVSFPDRAIGVDASKIRSAVLDLFWEGDAEDVQLVASTTHDTAQTRAAVAELVDLAQRGREDFEHQAGYGDSTAADVDAARARWTSVQQLTAELARHVSQAERAAPAGAGRGEVPAPRAPRAGEEGHGYGCLGAVCSSRDAGVDAWSFTGRAPRDTSPRRRREKRHRPLRRYAACEGSRLEGCVQTGCGVAPK